MKKTILLWMMMAAIAIHFVACEDANVSNLKRQVNALNLECPVSAGVGGNIVSCKYDEEKNIVTFNFQITSEFARQFVSSDSKQAIRENLKLMMQEKGMDVVVKDIVNAKAGVVFNYILPSENNKEVSYEFKYEELKSLNESPLSQQERDLRVMKNKIEVDNRRYPEKIDEGVILVKSELTDDFLVFHYDVDERMYPISMMKSNRNAFEEGTYQTIREMKNDPTLKNEVSLITRNGRGYKYIYKGDKTGATFEILIPARELAELAGL